MENEFATAAVFEEFRTLQKKNAISFADWSSWELTIIVWLSGPVWKAPTRSRNAPPSSLYPENSRVVMVERQSATRGSEAEINRKSLLTSAPAALRCCTIAPLAVTGIGFDIALDG